MRLSELAQKLGCTVVGDDVEITGVAGMERAGPTELTFLANAKYAPKVKHTRAAAILVPEPIRDLPIRSVISTNPYYDFARALASVLSAAAAGAGHSSAGVDCGIGGDR